MRIVVGTLQEIGAQVGDVVELVACGPVWNKNNDFVRGKHYTVGEERVDSGTGWFWIMDAHERDKRWRIIARANQGPVREVTTVRKEIVPGVYGRISVHKNTWADGKVLLRFADSGGEVDLYDAGHYMSCDELTAAITTLTQIRDAMADSSATYRPYSGASLPDR